MSAVRPGHEHEQDDGRQYGGEAGPGYDPLTDPLPPGEHASPWFRVPTVPAGQESQALPYPEPRAAGEPVDWYDREGYRQDWYGPEPGGEPEPAGVRASSHAPVPPRPTVPGAEQAAPHTELFETEQAPAETAVFETLDPGTRTPETPAADSGPAVSATAPVTDDETMALRTSDTRRAAEAPPRPGRADRRRAAKGRGRRRPAAAAAEKPAGPAKPMSRVEARRAAKAAKDSPAVIASRAIGELFITFGVLMLLFVTYQLWWTNVLAGQQADKAATKIQDDWSKGRKPDAFEPGQGFAIMYIPRLDVVVPIAEGIDKNGVLDRGMVGHYSEGKLKTAMPHDKQGNFAVAGHRNTHGEPFRYINHLEPGDPIVVETQDTYYTYEMASILPQTSPSNVSVIGPVPPGSGFTRPGRYITLTTCTPEFTSTYRMIVWGKMVEERPRSKGKPDALVG
ncbi:class E sortase [Streptomyces sp. PKU-EA00015]|uniref:class E sortase n=1 Tax=Streptomyces sp. PKU-EA00015 TaxID=2748326 RepID=UPI00159FE32E|nr:class E sortase [Streptomyces sp. PKU-EA00015]NWF26842.1 class E sortase [Streptomyces sp. PKU-EA00015]